MPADPSSPELLVAEVPSPLGILRMGYQGKRVSFVHTKDRRGTALPPPGTGRVRRPPFEAGSPPQQLREYFQGERTEFTVELDLSDGSGFDRKVWEELFAIPFGTYRTYGELARRIGRDLGSARAVGGAAGRNPIPIIVPCHRLVGTDRGLHGFGMGLWRKRWLLEHEGLYPLPPPLAAAGPERRRQTTLRERFG